MDVKCVEVVKSILANNKIAAKHRSVAEDKIVAKIRSVTVAEIAADVKYVAYHKSEVYKKPRL